MNTRPIFGLTMFLWVFLMGCSRDLDVPLVKDISKQDREAIGDYISEQILYNGQTYPLLVKDNRTTPAFLYVQALYDQITYSLRADFQSFSNRRWTKDRKWEVYIFESVDQIAFAVPGGSIYLSNQLLKSLRSTAELYYILSTEALLMNKRLLLKNLIVEYSTKTLKEIAQRGESGDNRLANIEVLLPTFNYKLFPDADLSQDIADHICRTSSFTPIVTDNLQLLLSDSSQWKSTRPLDPNINLLEVCGNELDEEEYINFVLDHL